MNYSVLIASVAVTARIFCPALELPVIFSDHMVLQQGRPLPVWGWASPGNEVTVRFADATVTCSADPTGYWRADLPPQSASAESRVLEVASGDTALKINDVVVGEVWLASGQSNMGHEGAGVTWRHTAQMVPFDGELPLARVFTPKRVPAQQGVDPVLRFAGGSWSVASRGQRGNVPTFFARGLQRALGVPVGVLHSSRGSSTIECWMSAEAIESDEQVRDHLEAQYASRRSIEDRAKAGTLSNAEQGYFDCRYPRTLYNRGIHPLVPYAFRGVIWYQGEQNGSDIHTYAKMQRAMANDWKRRFELPEMPFVYALITGLQPVPYQTFPDRLKHPRTRGEDQQNFLRLYSPAAMVVTTDLGGGLHPKQKPDTAARFLFETLSLVYGREVPRSPVPVSAERIDNKVVVRFEHVGSGLTAARVAVEPVSELPGEGAPLAAGQIIRLPAEQKKYGSTQLVLHEVHLDPDEPLRGFFLGTGDGAWHEAQARIEGDTVIVSSEDVPDPKVIRGCQVLEGRHISNLYNADGFPVSPFWFDL